MENINNVVTFFSNCSKDKVDKVFISYNDDNDVLFGINYMVDSCSNISIQELLYNVIDRVNVKRCTIRKEDDKTVLSISCYGCKKIEGEDLLASLRQFEKSSEKSFAISIFNLGTGKDELKQRLEVNGVNSHITKIRNFLKQSDYRFANGGTYVYIDNKVMTVDLPVVFR